MPALNVTYVTPLYPRGNYVQWEWSEQAPAGPWSFVVERSESPNGPFTKVSNPTVVDNLTFFDHLPLHHLGRWWYYRVSLLDGGSCKYTSKAETYLSSGQTLTPRLRGEIDKLRYNLSVLLEHDSGVEILVFKRRNEGVRCTSCMSTVLNISTNDQCEVCFGTKWVGGFYSPIRTLSLFNDPPIQEGRDDEGESELRVYQLKMLDIPLLAVDDLVFETGTGQLYEIKSTLFTKRKRVVIHQEPTASELSRSHSFYKKINNIVQNRSGYETALFGQEFPTL